MTGIAANMLTERLSKLVADGLIAREDGPYGTPNEIAALTNFLASPEAGFITGARMVVDGGMPSR